MESNQEALAQAIAVLLSTTPDTTLGKLLSFCLAAKFEGDVMAKTKELLDNPNKLPYWTMDVIGSDSKYTSEEWKALGDMKLTDMEDFINKLQQEIKSLQI